MQNNMMHKNYANFIMHLNFSLLNIYRPNILYYAFMHKYFYAISLSYFLSIFRNLSLFVLCAIYFLKFEFPIFSIREIKIYTMEKIDPNFYAGIFFLLALKFRKKFMQKFIFIFLFYALSGSFFYGTLYFIAEELFFFFVDAKKKFPYRNLLCILCALFSSLAILFYFLHKKNFRIKNDLTEKFIFDRAFVKIRGHYGFMQYDNAHNNLSTNLHDGSIFELVKLHMAIYKNFYERATEELKFRSGDYLKLKNIHGGELNFHAKENRFLSVFFSKNSEGETENFSELHLEFLCIKNKNNFIARETEFRIKNKFNQYLTQLCDGSFAFSHYGKKEAQIFSIELCENTIKKFHYQKKWKGKKNIFISKKNMRNLYFLIFDEKYRRLRKNWTENYSLDFSFNVFLPILCGNFYLLLKNYYSIIVHKKKFSSMEYVIAFFLLLLAKSSACFLVGIFSLNELCMHENIFIANIFSFFA